MSTWTQPGRLRGLGRGPWRQKNKSANSQILHPTTTRVWVTFHGEATQAVRIVDIDHPQEVTFGLNLTGAVFIVLSLIEFHSVGWCELISLPRPL